jgi:uncharacterized protein YfaT (DUF1175 family)
MQSKAGSGWRPKTSIRGAALLSAVVLLIAVASCGKATRLGVAVSKETISANKEDTVEVTITALTDGGGVARGCDAPLTVTLFGPEMSWVAEGPPVFKHGRASLVLLSTFTYGDLLIRAEAPGLLPGEAKVRVIGDYRDRDGDGMPDVVELFGDTDRLNFRRWFCAVAESQVFEENRRWDELNRDCAGLVRFAYIEALKSHDDAFFASYASLVSPANPDVKKYAYPRVPLLGTAVFRTAPGAFVPSDAWTNFSAAGSAEALLQYNVVFLGRDETGVLPGDLLFFFNPDNPRMPSHTMVYLGEWGREGDEDEGEDWLVYHTGPRSHDRGEVRKVRLSTLKEHPDRRWRPVKENDHFLGYYRFKILD